MTSQRRLSANTISAGRIVGQTRRKQNDDEKNVRDSTGCE